MKRMELNTLVHTNVRLCEAEVYAEAWTKRRSFTLYKNTPRSVSALFFICTELSASFITEAGERITARRGDVVYIPEGALYHARVDGISSELIDTYTVNFRLFDESGESLTLSDSITVLTHVEDDRFELRAAALWKALRQIDGSAEDPIGGGRNFLKINAELYSLLDAIVTAAQEHSDKYYPIRIGAEALKSEWNQNERIEKYAEMCGISNTYFYRCFREWSGKSPVEYRNLLRLSNAETMLRYTDMRIGEISEMIGFDDPFYFCRLFAHHYGSSPQKYRKAFRTAKE